MSIIKAKRHKENKPFIDENSTKDDNDIGTIQGEVVEIGITGDGRHSAV